MKCNALACEEEVWRFPFWYIKSAKSPDTILAELVPEFHKWISIMYHKPQTVVQVNRKRLEASTIERSFW